MAAGKELFKLWGLIGMQGVDTTTQKLKKVDKQARKTQKEIDRLGRRFSDVGKVLTKVFTIPLLAAAAASVKFIDDATDLNETISKTGELFGESAKEIEKWADTSATKIGQSKDQAMDAASTFAIFGRMTGMAGKDLVKFSTEFVELASDMASFFNTEPDQAITAIGAAFRGEMEPIRKYGVLLDDATMRQKALELGIVSSIKKALTPENKILAAQALIIDQTKIAQGDFARTSAGLANQKRILNAQLKNVSATLGQLFLPLALKAGKLVSRLIGYVERLVGAWKKLDPATRKTIKGFVLIVGALGPTVFLIGKLIALSKILIPIMVALKTGTLGWAGAMKVLSKSAMGITILIGALVALGWYWYSQWDTMSVQLKALWAKIGLIILKGVNYIVQGVTGDMLGLLGVLDKVAGVIPGLSDKIKGAKKAILLFQASMFKGLAKQQVYTNNINESAEANQSFTETLKKAIAAGKEAIGIKEKDIGLTDEQIKAQKELKTQKEKDAEDAKKFEEERLDFNKNIQEQLNQLKLTEMENLLIERDQKLAIAEQMNADIYAIEELYDLKIDALEKKVDKEKEKRKKEAIKNELGRIKTFGNRINSILSKFSDNKLKRLDIEEQREIAKINSSQLSEEQKEAAIQKLQEETDKKRQKIERQRAIREKVAALFSIAINTASAVVEALPSLPLALFVGALGLAEGIAVASTPLPFEEGGLVAGSPEGVNAIVGEKNQDEIVFPLERGIDLFIDGLLERIGEIEFPSFGAPDLAAAAPGGRDVHLHIGTFIGNRQGLKELERRLTTYRIEENQRKGF